MTQAQYDQALKEVDAAIAEFAPALGTKAN